MIQQRNWVFGPMRPALPPPRLTADIYETVDGDAYVIEIPVAGRKPDEIIIDATSESLTVSTKPQQVEAQTGRRYLQREQPVEAMSRLFEFPEEIDTDQVRATLENGLLKIEVPKAAAARRRVIRIEPSA
ncbi:MAG TPA: Hsp20/alpha crystallin family protein [Roseiflexaceae bacterium]|nr:Hsp20/alpha crystallin family protein [Roseiflexaceae bacterium]